MICLCHCCWTFHCTHGGGRSPGRAAGTRVPRCQPEARCGRGHGGVCSLFPHPSNGCINLTGTGRGPCEPDSIDHCLSIICNKSTGIIAILKNATPASSRKVS